MGLTYLLKEMMVEAHEELDKLGAPTVDGSLTMSLAERIRTLSIKKKRELYPEVSPLSKALRLIAQKNRLSSLDVPVLEDAADALEELQDEVLKLKQKVK